MGSGEVTSVTTSSLSIVRESGEGSLKKRYAVKRLSPEMFTDMRKTQKVIIVHS